MHLQKHLATMRMLQRHVLVEMLVVVLLWTCVVSSESHGRVSVEGSTWLVVFNSTAFAGAVLYNGSAPTVGFAPSRTPLPTHSSMVQSGADTRDETLHERIERMEDPVFNFTGRGAYTAVWTGTISGGFPTSMLFGLRLGAGQARLWVDDHLLVDTGPCCNTTVTAKFAVPVPFFPSSTTTNSARFRLEFTAPFAGTRGMQLALLVNGTTVDPRWIAAETPSSERQYFAERAEAETGWNTWLSGDMLTHAYLPHGLAVRLAFTSTTGDNVLTDLGEQGPKCDRSAFPATHGLHAIRGDYTEIASLDYANGTFKVESGTVGDDGTYAIQVTALVPAASPGVLRVSAEVPAAWQPRVCNVSIGAAATTGGSLTSGHLAAPTLLAECPGLPTIGVSSDNGVVRGLTIGDAAGGRGHGAASVSEDPSTPQFEIQLPTVVGGRVTVYAYVGRPDPKVTTAYATKAIATRRSELVNSFSRFGSKNDTYAGVSTAIAWNVIYTPYEGIFTPVFRGSPWQVSKPHNYVLFEWDTYLSAMIAIHTDPWVAKSNIIRMTKSLISYGGGYVAGFWNGLCGEVDKSKPPVGALALAALVDSDAGNAWVAHLLLDQHVLWNRWWSIRYHDGMVSPGSTREMMTTPIACTNQPPVVASRCETGLDNSPLYDESVFVPSANTIDSVDVGMSSLVVMDAQILANLSIFTGRTEFVAELKTRAQAMATAVATNMWDEDGGLFFNRMWTPSSGWAPKVATPTNFYPMLASVPTDAQVENMIARWLTNTSEFGVDTSFSSHGMPSVSRSSPAFKDNSYWRGRAWGPMNFLVYLGLQKYSHLPAAKAAMNAIAAQSEATFLIEWTTNGRVMENYNSVSGVGCDVNNAIPFYHWGALMGLIPLIDSGMI